MQTFKFLVFLLLCFNIVSNVSASDDVRASQLYVGAANVDITPPLPVALAGQMYVRVAHEIESPVTANILIVQNKGGKATVWVACDLVSIPEDLMSVILKKAGQAVPDIDAQRIIVSAIHTHTAPVTSLGYEVPEGVRTPEEDIAFISDQIAKGIKEAWKSLQPSSMTWGLGHAAVATNRRATYVDGTHQMYGDTHLSEFRGLEWASPDEVGVLFFWDKKETLIATAVDVPCPAQVVESRTAVNADYWHVVRENLKKHFGNQLVVIGWIGAAGDQSPHSMVEGPAEGRMRKLEGIDRLHQLGNRISRAVERVYDVVKNDKHNDVELIHEVRTLHLPKRPITHQASLDAEKAIEMEKAKPADKRRTPFMSWKQKVVDRYNEQLQHPDGKFETPIHVVRLGDVAICTNQFELFHSFGERIKARSKALQAFNIQLVGRGTYLPTRDALLGGGYSAIPESNVVGPSGGQVLVDQTVELMNSMFTEDMHTKQR
jgi:hypothetical protein